VAKKLFADPNTTCIYRGSDSVISAPLDRLEDVFFHSNLQYMNVLDKTRTTVSFSSVNNQLQSSPTTQRVLAYSHGLAFTPLVIAFIHNVGSSGVPFMGTFTLKLKDGNDISAGDIPEVQQFYLITTSSGVVVQYQAYGVQSALSLDITFYLMELK
jgi:hypothetical protein